MGTIVAISSPKGRGALGVVRLSGPESLQITSTLAGNLGDIQPRYATLRTLADPDTSAVIDQALITYFAAPHSLTGEDVVEISCHGSPVVLRRVIERAIQAGALAAGPGEFTLRALANGKLNLAQAEAIRDLIASQTQAAAHQAALQINGELSIALGPFKSSLLDVIVVLESALEFVEDDLAAPHGEKIVCDLRRIAAGVAKLAQTFSTGQLIKDGIHVTLAGSPNVGKSSIFNKLLSIDRAIVTDIPGTTRDSLSEPIEIDGVPVWLTDTAGIRGSPDVIENLGIERSVKHIARSDLVVAVLDGSRPVGPDDLEMLAQTREVRRLVVANKSDLITHGCGDMSNVDLTVSALTGDGIEELRAAILSKFERAVIEPGNLVVINARHHDLLQSTVAELKRATELLEEGRTEELVLMPMHNALTLLGQITGETTPEEILSQIFATFCIGK
ncbi:MAG: tRNA uridine-5-carboxymethylaminomethyl(34) synthesis GTPase MnmE [Pyrinomonadaceae bacterium]